jgi:methyl-accepting chemotaxis protein
MTMFGRLQLSISTKLYTIFALLVAVTAMFSIFAVFQSRHHAALTGKFGEVFEGLQNVERVNGLIYAVVMESRGVYMSDDLPTSRKYAGFLLKFNEQLAVVMKNWQQTVGPDDTMQFEEFSQRVNQFISFRKELARLGMEVSGAAGREWGDNDANRSVRTALNKDLEQLAALYAKRSRAIYAEMQDNIDTTVWVTSLLATGALLLATIGAIIIWRAVTRPLGEIARVIETVASGAAGVTIPYRERGDEIGALSRSIGVFEDAMRRNEKLSRAVVDEAEARNVRQQQMMTEINSFGGGVENTLTELALISEQMLKASAELSFAADQAAKRTDSAMSASAEASTYVRSIAAAAEELSASVVEIDRQVRQSNAMTEKAIVEAKRTNAEIKALDDAAKRIGDVVKLITAIAEQTNLLSLNATIEAARAGDAGKGFAVVAGEVKALAGQTAKATKEISSQVGAIQQSTSRSVDAIGTIQHTIHELGEITMAITTAIAQQSAATHEISHNAVVAAARTGDSASEVHRVGEATNDTRENATSVKSVADGLDLFANRIRNQLNGFFQKLRSA